MSSSNYTTVQCNRGIYLFNLDTYSRVQVLESGTLNSDAISVYQVYLHHYFFFLLFALASAFLFFFSKFGTLVADILIKLSLTFSHAALQHNIIILWI